MYSITFKFQVQTLFLEFNKVYICLTEQLWILDPSNKNSFLPVNVIENSDEDSDEVSDEDSDKDSNEDSDEDSDKDSDKNSNQNSEEYSYIITGMHQSAIEGNVEDIQFYLDHLQHDKNPPCRGKNGSWNTPLHEAAKHGHVDILNLFHENLPDISIKDSGGFNALHIAAAAGQMSAVKFLVDVISTDAVTNDGRNALHLAAFNGHLAVVEILAQIIPIETKTKKGETAYDLSKQKDHQSVADYLENLGRLPHKTGQD